MKNVDEIERYLAGEIADIRLGAVAAADVTADSSLMGELGLDSLDYATVVLGSEQWLGTKVSEDGVQWRDLQTVGQLAEFLYRSQSGAADA